MKTLSNLIILFAFMVMGVVPVNSNEAETNLKSTFILKFCQYIDWPNYVFSKPDSAIIIGVAGEKDQVENLASLAFNLQCKGRPFRVYSMDLSKSYIVPKPHILYVSRHSNNQTIADTLVSTDAPMLTITDTEEGENGAVGIINFKSVQNRIRFDISLNQAKRLGIHIASPLLAVADKVDGVEQP